MNIFGLEIRKASKKEISGTIYPQIGVATGRVKSNAMLLPAVYRCVDLISSSLAVLPLKVYELDKDGYKREAKEHPLNWLLNTEPNEDMTRHTFFKTLQTSVLLRGNGYAYIERDARMNPAQLIYLDPTSVEVVFIMDGNGIRRKRYKVKGFKDLVEPCDMVHTLNFSYDGLKGLSTLEHARLSLDIASAQEDNAAGFFKSGSAMTGVLTVETGGSIPKERKQEMYKNFEERVGAGHRGGVVILEGNMKYQPISISNADAQFLESRQWTVLEVARFFSVVPTKLYDLSKSSYSTLEQAQLQFLSDTLHPVIDKWEQELNRKLITGADRGRYIIEFDTTALLRSDKSAQASWFNTLFQNGALSSNEIRREINLPPVDGGDSTFIQVNMQRLDQPVQADGDVPQE